MTREDIPSLLRQARTARRLTTAQVDRICGLPGGYCYAIERGRIIPSNATLQRLHQLLNLFQSGTKRPRDLPANDVALGTHRMTYHEWQDVLERVKRINPVAVPGLVASHRAWCRANNEEALF